MGLVYLDSPPPFRGLSRSLPRNFLFPPPPPSAADCCFNNNNLESSLLHVSKKRGE